MKARIWNHRFWIKETQQRILYCKFTNLLSCAGFEKLHFADHRFNPQGYTAFWLLGESHLALHTFPEEGKTYVELSSCNKEMFLKFKRLLK